MKIKFLFCVIMSVIFVPSSLLFPKAFQLKKDLINFLDGFVVKKAKYKTMLKNKAAFMRIFFGDLVNGARIGIYVVNEIHYSLHDLKKGNHNLSEQELQEVLALVLNDIISTSLAYVVDARGSKAVLLDLIEDSCAKHQHHKSPLLRWAATKDGDEEAQMRRDLKTLDDCYFFTVSLLHFLGDMLFSCQKAKHEYEQYQAQKKSKKIRH